MYFGELQDHLLRMKHFGTTRGVLQVSATFQLYAHASGKPMSSLLRSLSFALQGTKRQQTSAKPLLLDIVVRMPDFIYNSIIQLIINYSLLTTPAFSYNQELLTPLFARSQANDFGE